ncbi:PREDICTED: uncharacterized protein LOC106121807 isoform X1 [Papilio xuthus]|uniref:Uncharacterized protein LOC106121807 isoform X1 n=2 Tax=Papilio xuthus TaxID=66420 RepID=A0A194PIA7_PAPXU|nr:PREDICTED: uncharacterized protein LOC106121807 isoform X1 [Papilio xuthus]KPI92459.1 hypothetical protein RR46_13680 [Papilio xuthus]
MYMSGFFIFSSELTSRMTPQEERENARGVEIADAFEEEMFGPPRTEPAARPKLSMISARLRANEERKRVIEICSQKLENIEDPARDLRRSVCINNTYCRLSEEARKEKEARRRRAREECDDSWAGKKARREVEDECLALLDAIPELGDANLGCAQLARQLPRQDVPLLPPSLLTVLDS